MRKNTSDLPTPKNGKEKTRSLTCMHEAEEVAAAVVLCVVVVLLVLFTFKISFKDASPTPPPYFLKLF